MHYVVPIMTAEEELICFQFFGNDGFISDFNLQKIKHLNIKMN